MTEKYYNNKAEIQLNRNKRLLMIKKCLLIKRLNV